MTSIDDILKSVKEFGRIPDHIRRTIEEIKPLLHQPIIVVTQDAEHRMGGVLIETPMDDTVRITSNVLYSLLQLNKNANARMSYQYLNLEDADRIIYSIDPPILVVNEWYSGFRKIGKPGDKIEGSWLFRDWKYDPEMKLYLTLYEAHLKHRENDELFVNSVKTIPFGG